MSARGQSAFSITLVARPLLAKIWGRARGFVTLPNDTRWIELEHPWGSLTLAPIICSKRQPGHHYTYRASTHVQQLSDNQQRRLEAETTHEREERLQQRKLDTETTALRSRSPHNA